MENRLGGNHFGIQQGFAGDLPHEIPKMPIGAVHHWGHTEGVKTLRNWSGKQRNENDCEFAVQSSNVLYLLQHHGGLLPILKEMVEKIKIPVICEGGISTPEMAKQAIQLGADAVVVGTAITGIDSLVQKYQTAIQ